MNKEPEKTTRLSLRRIFVLIGVLLLLLAAAGLAIAYSRTSARKSIEEGKINQQALAAPTPELKPSPTPRPILTWEAPTRADPKPSPPPNQPPTVALVIGAVSQGADALHHERPNTVCAGDRVALTATASDPDGDTLSYTWTSAAGRMVVDAANTQFDTTGLAPGDYAVTVKVDDWCGGVVLASKIIQVSRCIPLSICFGINLDVTPASSRVKAGETVSFSTAGVFGGRGYGSVTYSWKASAGRIIGDGLSARLDTTGVANETNIEVSVVATSETGNCSATGASQVIVNGESSIEEGTNISLDSDGLAFDDEGATTDSVRQKGGRRARLAMSSLPTDPGVEQTFAPNPRCARLAAMPSLPSKERVRRRRAPIVTSTGSQSIPHPTTTPIPKLQYQEEVKGDSPSRVETEAKDTISLCFVRKLVQNPTTVATSTTEGERTKVTETVNQIPGRSLETPLEQAMGEGYEPWIKATLSSSTFEATPKNADWRRLDASQEITWEWAIRTNSKMLLQELKAEIDVEWRPVGATKGEVIKHRLWEGAIQIDVDNPVLKVEQVKTATPIFSVAGLASIVVGVYPRKRRKEGEGESDETAAANESFDLTMAEPADETTLDQRLQKWSPDSDLTMAKLKLAELRDKIASKQPAIIPVRAGKEDDETNEAQELVECSVFAPPTVPRGATIMVQVFAHLEGRSADAEKMALEFDDTARRRAVKTLSSRVARETELMFHLTISNWKISEPVQTQIWMGDAESVQFVVDVPTGCKLGAAAGKVTVSQNSVPIGQISFILKVVEQEERAEQTPVPTGDDARRYKYAFVSYASADRDKVLARVQMLEQMGIEYFQDILDLDPGDRWEKELYKNIDQCDLFLLFWSQHAKESPWVMKEVEYALARKGADENAPPEIKPVIIEGPPIISPPEKLAKLHFNDRLIYFFSRK